MSGTNGDSGDLDRPATYTDVFRIREYRWIWSAQLLSVLGDQLAQVALAILVYDRTGSPLLSALTYALMFLPQIAGGPVLAGLADLLPRRTLMIVCDVVRAGLVATMAIPGMPLWALMVLLFAIHLIMAPFGAARAAILPDVLRGDRYVLGNAVSNMTFQSGNIFGLGLGGVVVAFAGTRDALVIDAFTFVVSAVLLAAGVRKRPAPAAARTKEQSAGGALLSSTAAGARLVFGNRRLRCLAVMGWLCGFFVVPEGLAAPYMASIGHADIGTGLMMAAPAIGTVIGMTAVGRFLAPSVRLRAMGPLAALTCLPLVVFAAFPGVTATLMLLIVMGAASSYQLPANAAFVAEVPNEGRGQAFGLVQAGIHASQGLAIVIGGAAAKVLAPQLVIAISGALGLLVAIWAAFSWSHAPAAASADSEVPQAGPETPSDTGTARGAGSLGEGRREQSPRRT